MLQAGAPLVRLSGSGPTLFAPFADLAQAVMVQRRLQAQAYETYLSRAVSPGPGEVDIF
jgi:4-diphosphocytidyl-2-C-methyl-D-erythritol kinase